jgi:putative ABC transport system permease protein
MRTDLQKVFRHDGLTVTASRRTVRNRNLMAVAQVALAFVLLMGAGLLVLSFGRLSRVDPGFEDPASILHGFIDLPAARYPDEESQLRFTEELLIEMRALPGVSEAAITTRLPFVTFENTTILLPEGYEPRSGESLIAHRVAIISPGYFRTMGIPLLRGRDFTVTDAEGTPNAIIIDEWIAEHYWPGENPIGRRMRSGTPGQEIDDEVEFYTVVGVVGSVRYADLAEPSAGGRGAFYVPFRQVPSEFMVPVLRTESDPLTLAGPLQERILEIDPDIPFYFPTAYDTRLADSTLERRIPMILLIIFACLALFLCAVGLYGVLAYAVTQRTRELGIRLAVGSTHGEIFRLIISDGLRLLARGLGIGVLLALVLLQILRSLLYEVAPTNILVLTAIIVLLSAVTVTACFIPARRATRINPVAALKHE